MKLITRALLLTFILGLTVLLVALQTPTSSFDQSLPAGSQARQIYFFQPMMVSISISQLQGNATLLVQPVNYDSSLGEPIVNVSVIAQDIITFSIHNRGYYVVSFSYDNGSNPAVSYVVDESGIPSDLWISGIVLMVLAGALYLISFVKPKFFE
jgi:hypothetical protein